VSLFAKPKRNVAAIAAAGPIPGADIQILGMEIAQTVQNLANEVPLIRGKATVVRVYVNPRGLTRKLQLQGEITAAPSPGAPVKYVASQNTITATNAAYPDLPSQRRSLALSLNFLLPADALGWSAVSIVVNRIWAQGIDLPVSAANPVTLPIEPAPPLRVKAIGLRYTWNKSDGTSTDVTPEAYHFDFLRSYLSRAYPVAAVEWSQLVVQAHPLFTPPFSGPAQPNGNDPLWSSKLNLVHNQLSALRAKDMDSGTDPRTHYYGLVSDASAGLFFRGAAKDVPDAADPTVVAAGPVGDPQQYPLFSWDKDRSFGDWYGAHELAHTFGRPHPGFCGQDASDPDFPYPDGRIGDSAHGDMMGLDVGDPQLNLPMRVLSNEQCHDVMTYCDNVWVSAHSYQAVLKRLREEDALFARVA
jgi:hypothetical protein